MFTDPVSKPDLSALILGKFHSPLSVYGLGCSDFLLVQPLQGAEFVSMLLARLKRT